MLKVVAGLLFGTMILAAADQAAAPSCGLVPGWTQDGKVRSYAPDTLFEYMDGNSEGYLLYNFQGMQGVTCRKGDITFVLDISDMGDQDFAYGMFASTRDLRQPQQQIGMGGQIVPRRLIFAKGKYYVEIAANPEGDHTAALQAWATALEKATPGDTSVPPMMSWFPKEKQELVKLLPESVLGLRMLRWGYIAQYSYGKAFVVIEDTPESATSVMKQFRQRFADAADAKLGEEAFQASDRYLGKLFVFRKGKYIAGFAITGDGADLTALTTGLAAKVQ